MKKIISALLLIILFLVGCHVTNTPSSQEIAKHFMDNENYKVISFKHEISLTITKNALKESPMFKDLLVQPPTFDVTDFINKEIQILTYTVDDHPLSSGNNNKVILTLWVHENEVVGGTSSIAKNETLYGSPHYLDGSKLEDFYSSFNSRKNDVEKMLLNIK